jgi:cysteine desulfurase
VKGYLDHAAHSPLRPEIRRRLAELSGLPLGNPSSLHGPGRQARMLLEEARETCAGVLGAKVEEVVFTSGATEANNLALRGLLAPGSHLLVSAVEHPSVRDCACALPGVDVEEIPVDRQGLVDPADVRRRLRPNTRLISVMAVNNEVGTIQPTEELAGLGVPLHVDGVQDRSLAPRGADLYSLSGHKLGAPVGIGLLYVRQGLALPPMLVGGSQEDNRRAGTSPAVAAALLALALQLPQPDVTSLRTRLEAGLARLGGLAPLAVEAPRAGHISAWLTDGMPAETVLVALDLEGVAASSGSACSSHSIEPSHVLQAMGYSTEQSRCLVRFSLGWNTTEEDVEQAISAMGSLRRQRV